jgi:hypothetical protein
MLLVFTPMLGGYHFFGHSSNTNICLFSILQIRILHFLILKFKYPSQISNIHILESDLDINIHGYLPFTYYSDISKSGYQTL